LRSLDISNLIDYDLIVVFSRLLALYCRMIIVLLRDILGIHDCNRMPGRNNHDIVLNLCAAELMPNRRTTLILRGWNNVAGPVLQLVTSIICRKCFCLRSPTRHLSVLL
jgi:hypothetical protein